MNRLKGMHGVCLHPGNAYIELKVRLYNRTPFLQTFLWWANIGTHVHELYQSFFSSDVHWVADHARRAMSRFPLCDGYYYGVNYGEREIAGVPAEERPPNFVSPGTYPANDLSWYANIPVPTSYMAMGSSEDFHGGYDHRCAAGLVLIADHHIAPGKKQWTWGNHPFGYAWDRNLTDEDGPYIELMAQLIGTFMPCIFEHGAGLFFRPEFVFFHSEGSRDRTDAHRLGRRSGGRFATGHFDFVRKGRHRPRWLFHLYFHRQLDAGVGRERFFVIGAADF